MSVTIADAIVNSGVHAGVVMTATSTSPGFILLKSSGVNITHAVAVTLPALAPSPLMTLPDSFCRDQGISFAQPDFSGSMAGGTSFICSHHSALRAGILFE